MAAASIYNHHRFARQLLKKSRKNEASFTIELYTGYWKFKGANSELAYDGPMKPFLTALRAQQIPAFLIPTLMEQDPPIFMIDGCLVIEIHDYRPPSQSNPNLPSAPNGVPDENDKLRAGTNVFANNPFRGAASLKNGVGLGQFGGMRRGGVFVKQEMGMIAGGVGLGIAGPGGMINPQVNPFGMTNPEMILPPNAQASSSNLASGNGITSSLQQQQSQFMLNENGEPICSKHRVIMKPDSETLYESLLNVHQSYNRTAGREQKPPLDWDDHSLLDLEARILAAVSPPITLDTSFLSVRVANLASALTTPALPYMAHDGSYIPRAKRRNYHFGTAPRSAAADEEDDGPGGGAGVGVGHGGDEGNKPMEMVGAERRVTKPGDRMGVSKKDWKLIMHGMNGQSVPGIQFPEHPHIPDEFFLRRQQRIALQNQGVPTNGPPDPNQGQGPGQGHYPQDGPVQDMNNGAMGSVNGDMASVGDTEPVQKPKPKPKPKKKKAPAAAAEQESVNGGDDNASVAGTAAGDDVVPPAKPKGGGKAKGKNAAAGGGGGFGGGGGAATKGKNKRTADEMNNDDGTQAGSPMTIDTNVNVPTGPTTATPTTAASSKTNAASNKTKKSTKKQLAQQAAAEAQAKQEALAAEEEAAPEPPKKKVKKSAGGGNNAKGGNATANGGGGGNGNHQNNMGNNGNMGMNLNGLANNLGMGGNGGAGSRVPSGMPPNLIDGIDMNDFAAFQQQISMNMLAQNADFLNGATAANMFGNGMDVDPTGGMMSLEGLQGGNMPLQFQPPPGMFGLQGDFSMGDGSGNMGGGGGGVGAMSRQPGGGGGGGARAPPGGG